MDLQNNRLLTCPPESLDIGLTANDITGSATCIEVIVYLTDPSVNVSPVDARSGESGTEIAKDGSITWKKYGTENILDSGCLSIYLKRNQRQTQQQSGQHVLLEYPILTTKNKDTSPQIDS
jgi:hypothetical protein